MMAKNLTSADVKKAKPTEKAYEIADGSLTGFTLRVQPSGKKIYRVRYRVNGRQTSFTIGDANIKTLTEARNKAKEILADAAKGVDTIRRRKIEKANTLGGYIDTYYRDYALQHLSAHADALGRIKRNFGHLNRRALTAIAETDIQRWRRSRQGEVTFATMVKDFGCLKAVLNRAIKDKVIASHQLQGYTLEKAANERSNDNKLRYLSDEEESRLRASLIDREARLRRGRISGNAWRAERGRTPLPQLRPDEFADHIKPIVLLALNTGLRLGDLLSLEWCHVDLNLRQIRKVINKTRRKVHTPAILPLSSEAYSVLRQWRDQTTGDGLVFPSPVSGGQLDNIKKAWGTVRTDAKVTGFRFHDLRHTFASRLVMGGVDLNTVRELMTHGDIKMTLVYAHLSPDHKAEAVASVFDKRG